MRFVERLKTRYGVGLWGVLAILAAFSLAGMTVVRLKNPVLGFLLPDDSPAWLRWTVYILVITPLYQIVLLFWGALLGQFNFFWSKMRRVGQFLATRVGGRSQQSSSNPLEKG